MKNVAPNKILTISDLSDDVFEKNINNDKKIELKPLSSIGVINIGNVIGLSTALLNKQNLLSGNGVIKITSGSTSYILGNSSQFIKGDGSLDNSVYLTSITSGLVTSALGYTPYNSTNPNNFITSNLVESTYAPLNSPKFVGNVGIGTTSPNTKLEIYGGSLLVNTPRTSTSSKIPIAIGTQKYDGTGISGLAGMYHVEAGTGGFGQAGSLGFYTSIDDVVPTEKLRISSTGNVGIGTTSPTKNLDVVGNSNTSDSYYLNNVLFGRSIGQSANTLNARVISNNTGTGGYGDGLYLGYDNSGGSMTRIFDGSINNYVGIGSGTFSTVGISKFLFGTQYDDGTDNQFAGNVKVKGILRANSNFAMDTNNMWIYMTDVSGANRRVMGLAPDNTFYVGDVDNTISVGNNLYSTNGVHAFRNNGVEKMRISQNGTIGIGTSNSLAMTHIVGTGFTDILRFTSTQTGAHDWTINPFILGVSNGGLSFNNKTLSLTPFVISTTGNVGIGTTAPLAPLNVSGDNNDIGQVVISGTTNSNKSLYLGYNTTGNYGVMQPLIQGTAYSNLSLNPNGGNIGIGTTAPVTKFHVLDDTAPEITVGTSTFTKGAIYFGNSNHGIKRNYSNVNDVGLYTTSGDIHLSAITNVPQFTLKQSGNVGIGTTTPSYLLSVAGTTNTSKLIVNNTVDNGANLQVTGTSQLGTTKISGAFYSSTRQVTAVGNATVLATDHVLIVSFTGFNITWDTPSSTYDGREIIIVNNSGAGFAVSYSFYDLNRNFTNYINNAQTYRFRYLGNIIYQI